MTKFRALALSVTLIMLIAANYPSLNAQVASPTSQSASITVSLALEKNHVPVGQKPMAVVIIKNISHQEIGFSTASDLYRIHVEGHDGEPPKTEYNRHRHGDFRPGDGPDLVDGPVISRSIAPGSLDHQTYDLTVFYDLSKPGKYSVYIEIYDPLSPQDGSGIWLRTNTAQFAIEASTQ
ncbi:MAG: hypothetical protein P4L10_04975 [Acidobacteriaceae bacterium]|nr:hypothetical protein [Acidobacteriaceae bacterium]